MRGEKVSVDIGDGSEPGSPPHARGKAKQAHGCSCPPGITPARAGKRHCSSRTMRRTWDHPRVRGEKCIPTVLRCSRSGSPPRVRGKAAQPRPVGRYDGITPACAGKSDRSPCRLWRSQDHPRACGEKSMSYGCASCSQGSPPRVRGKGARFRHCGDYLGITPARAGKSLAPAYLRVASGDHPRACGEKHSLYLEVQAMPGSPPRVRGKADLRAELVGWHGITPACAGKSIQR